MNKTGIKRLALAMIIQAIKDLHITNKEIENTSGLSKIDKYSAHKFFESDLGKLCAEILDIKVMRELYNKYRTKRLMKGDLTKRYKLRKDYKRKYRIGVKHE